jgi:hypothetical protein
MPKSTGLMFWIDVSEAHGEADADCAGPARFSPSVTYQLLWNFDGVRFTAKPGHADTVACVEGFYHGTNKLDDYCPLPRG